MDKATKQKIVNHYDKVSPYYQKHWGDHIHHGYYITNKESNKQATENLMTLLIDKCNLKKHSKILDIGCGVGGTSIYLANNYNCDVTGITISPVQVAMAESSSKGMKKKPKFQVVDANKLAMAGKYDYLFAIEMISHLDKRSNFFRNCSRLLRKKGRMSIAAWLKESDITAAQEDKFIKPIEKGMLVELPTKKEYFKHFDNNGLRLFYFEDISSKVKKTWDISLEIIEDRSLWKLALEHGDEFVDFLKAFHAMKKGFSSGAFRYVVMVIEKI
ncbi:SAM-dependent methyltransferase [Nanoarchaeota archaeon]